MQNKVVIIGISGNNKDILLAPIILKAYLNNKVDVDILNYKINVNINQILKDIEKYDTICFSCYVWNIKKVKKIIKMVPNKRIVLGGPEINKESQEGNVTSFIGEGEIKLSNYLLNENSKIKLINLGELPQLYNKYLKKESERFTIEAQRGCNFKCHFCLYNKLFEGIRYYNPANVIKDINHMYKLGYTEGRIVDANFFSKHKHTSEILNGLIKNKIKLKLFFEVNPVYVNKELSDLCANYISNSNELYVSLGLQSINKVSLKAVNRVGTIIHFENAINKLSNAGCRLRLDIILGLPFETKQSYFDLIKYIVPKLGALHDIGPNVLHILPNTVLSKTYKQLGVVLSNKGFYDVYETNTLPRKEFIECLKITTVVYRLFNPYTDENTRKSFIELIKNNDIIDILYKMINLFNKKLKNTNFVKLDYPDAENFYYKKINTLITNLELEDMIKKLADK